LVFLLLTLPCNIKQANCFSYNARLHRDCSSRTCKSNCFWFRLSCSTTEELPGQSGPWVTVSQNLLEQRPLPLCWRPEMSQILTRGCDKSREQKDQLCTRSGHRARLLALPEWWLPVYILSWQPSPLIGRCTRSYFLPIKYFSPPFSQSD